MWAIQGVHRRLNLVNLWLAARCLTVPQSKDAKYCRYQKAQAFQGIYGRILCLYVRLDSWRDNDLPPMGRLHT
jgi:hypothetical protein